MHRLGRSMMLLCLLLILPMRVAARAPVLTTGWQDLPAQIRSPWDLPGSFYPLLSPADRAFPYIWQDQRGQLNPGTLAYVDRLVSLAPDGRVQFGGSFSGYYAGLLAQTPPVDEAQVLAGLQHTAALATLLVATYEGLYGSIAPGSLAEAGTALHRPGPVTPLEYVIGYVAGAVWSCAQALGQPPITVGQMQAATDLPQALPCVDAPGLQVVAVIDLYFGAVAESAAPLRAAEAQRQAQAQMRANLQPAPTYQIGQPPAAIENDLRNAERQLVLTQRVSGRTTVTWQFQGISLVPIAPDPWNPASKAGWFDPQMLGRTPRGAKIGRVTGLLIANPPAVAIDAPGMRVWITRSPERFSVPAQNQTAFVIGIFVDWLP